MAARFVIKKGTGGKFRFSLLAGNGQLVATSELYETRAACMNGIRSLKRLAVDAPIEDLTITGPEMEPVCSPRPPAVQASPQAAPAAAGAPEQPSGAGP
jgi:uncharacterized protein